MNLKVDEFLSNAKKWRKEMEALRAIILDYGLTEELKWRTPCYTSKKKNIVLIGEFKAYCALSFLKGALLKDSKGVLKKPGENSQSARLIRFTEVKEIVEMESIIKAYIFEAIEVEKAGLKVDFKEKTALVYPEEFIQKLDENPALKTAFDELTPGRQRAYNLYFSAPKQAKTRTARIEKYTQRILEGIGFNDCTCGQSKKLPYCDGSHKFI